MAQSHAPKWKHLCECLKIIIQAIFPKQICGRDECFGSTQRYKVTFGIWVVTHSSAGGRLSYVLIWKRTSCMIILYSRLNGVHPSPYLVNMSHLICVCECLCCAWAVSASRENAAWPCECGLNIVCPCLRSCHMKNRSQYGEDYPVWRLVHLMFLCDASDGSKISDDREAQRKEVYETLHRRSPGGDCYSYTCISNQRFIKCGMSAAALCTSTSALRTRLNHKCRGMGLQRLQAYWESGTAQLIPSGCQHLIGSLAKRHAKQPCQDAIVAQAWRWFNCFKITTTSVCCGVQ